MRLVFPIAILFFLSCNPNSRREKESIGPTRTKVSETPPGETSPASDPVIDSLMKLPLIIKSNHYIDSFSQHKNGISFISDTTATEITVKAGYNGPERFETYYIFSIDRKSGKIKIMDPVEGDYIPLEVYQENNQ